MSKKSKNDVLVNENITTPEISLVDNDGIILGVFLLNDALDMAVNRDLDLVQFSKNNDVVICKIIDYNRFLYEQKKQTKKQKTFSTSEFQLRPVTASHDQETIANKAKKALAKGNKVKIIMRFRGRELSFKDKGKEVFDTFVDMLGDDVKFEIQPKFVGDRLIALIHV